ncbi:hypothetical protein [Sphingomonas sp.]|uniref:hypothetical protein n=1 Tax=Sphingomonas sp. TaxID=28214 RepID=UPI003CC61A83
MAELDTASITYPPVMLRTRRRARELYLSIPLAALQRDADGDGLTDIAAHHLLLDQPAGERPFVVGSDAAGACTAPSREAAARAAVLAELFDPAGQAIVEPVDRPAGQLAITGWQRAAAAADRPLFLLGDPADFACLRPTRPMLVYTRAQIAALARFSPGFHVLEVPPIVFNRAHDRGFVRWSSGWAGGTYRLRWIGGRWAVDTISSWVT